MVIRPDGTLLLAAALSVGAGAFLAALAAIGIYLGATRLPPRVAPGRVWAEWRGKRMLWAFWLVLSACAAALASDAIWQRVALRDLYWLGRPRDVLWVCRLGAASGYLLVLFLLTLGAALRRRR